MRRRPIWNGGGFPVGFGRNEIAKSNGRDRETEISLRNNCNQLYCILWLTVFVGIRNAQVYNNNNNSRVRTINVKPLLNGLEFPTKISIIFPTPRYGFVRHFPKRERNILIDCLKCSERIPLGLLYLALISRGRISFFGVHGYH